MYPKFNCNNSASILSNNVKAKLVGFTRVCSGMRSIHSQTLIDKSIYADIVNREQKPISHPAFLSIFRLKTSNSNIFIYVCLMKIIIINNINN